MSVSLSALHIRAVVLDIEGTTTPVDFVYQVLFPYARAHVPAFLSREWNSAACREAVAILGRLDGNTRGVCDQAIAYLVSVQALVASLREDVDPAPSTIRP